MVLPDSFNGSLSDLGYYQGVLLAEVSLMLVMFLVLRMVHYVKWGFDE